MIVREHSPIAPAPRDDSAPATVFSSPRGKPALASAHGKSAHGVSPWALFHRIPDTLLQPQNHFNPLPVPPQNHGQLVSHIAVAAYSQQIPAASQRLSIGGEKIVPLLDAGLRSGRACSYLNHLQAPCPLRDLYPRLQHCHTQLRLRLGLAPGKKVVDDPLQ